MMMLGLASGEQVVSSEWKGRQIQTVVVVSSPVAHSYLVVVSFGLWAVATRGREPLCITY